jgi:hypothetical protein
MGSGMTRSRSIDSGATADEWAPRILAGLADGSHLRIPLAVFHSSSLRRDLERELVEQGRSPRWDEAKPALDDSGRSVRVVPVLPVEAKPAPALTIAALVKPDTLVDDGWELE